MIRVTHDEHGSELLAAFALDALDGDEQAAIEAHLEQCESCRAEVDELREVSARLAGEVVPPPAVWDRIRADITLPSQAQRSDDPREASQRRLLAVAAAVVLVLGVAVGRISAGQQAEPTIGDLAAAAAEATASRTVVLSSRDGEQIARVLLAESGEAYVLAGELAALPTGRVYQLWAITGDQTVSVAILGRNPEVVPVGAPKSFDALAITVEPSSGSPGPTSEPIAVAAV